MESILSWWNVIASSPIFWSILTLTVAKLLPNKVIDHLGHSVGVFLTLGLSRILPFWNKAEEYFIDGLAIFITGVIKGLRSDNPTIGNDI